MAKRWEDDDRGQGVGDAAQLVAGATELVAAFGESAWVAELPELHLRPHVDAWCRHDQRLRLKNAHADDADAYILDLEWCGEPGSIGEVRAAAFR